MSSKDKPDLIPLHIIADAPEARRLAEAMNRLGGQMLTAIDGAIQLRTAPPAAQRARHVVRGLLAEAAIQALIALGHTTKPDHKGD